MTAEEFEKLIENNQPHPVFNNDWNSFDSMDFGANLLPDIIPYTPKAVRFYDGAELFSGLTNSEEKLFFFDDYKQPVSIIAYSYPKGVLAEKRKDRFAPTENEIATFIEVEKDDSLAIYFKFGRRFKEYLKKTLEHGGQSESISYLEAKVYKTNLNASKNFFNSELAHYNMMLFVLNTLDIEEPAIAVANYTKLFSPKVISYMENFAIAGKYKARVFIETSQWKVYLKTEESKDRSKMMFPDLYEIYIWLVSEDYINYDTSFITVQLGDEVARDFKQRKIKQQFIEKLILDQIKEEIDQNIFSKNKGVVQRGVKRSLADSMIRLWFIEKLGENETNREIFETNPTLFLSLQAASFVAEELEAKKLQEHHWNPKTKPYTPLIDGDTTFNATICGLINGIIDEVKAIPDMIALFSKIFGSEKEYQEFVNGIKKLLDEGIVKTIIEEAFKEYEEAFKEGNVEKLYYNFAHDIIQIVSLIIGVFQLAKGAATIVANFIKFVRKATKYLKRYGRKSIDTLKKLNKKELKEVFDDLDEQKPLRIKLKTKKMESYFVGEETGVNSWCAPSKVKYLDEFQRLKFKVVIKNGKLFNSKGKLLDTSKAGTIFSGKGKAIFVMDDKGNIFISNFQEPHLFHHSSLVAGQPVAGAGEIKVIDGVVKEISIKSGHYRPKPELNKQVIKVLKERSVSTRNIKLVDQF